MTDFPTLALNLAACTRSLFSSDSATSTVQTPAPNPQPAPAVPTPPKDTWQFRSSPAPIAYDICKRNACEAGKLMVKFFDDNQSGTTQDEMQRLQSELKFQNVRYFDSIDTYLIQLPENTSLEQGLSFFQNHMALIDFAEPSIVNGMQAL